MTQTYNYTIWGRGGEITIGTVSQEVAEYWEELQENDEYSLNEYCDDFDNDFGIEEDLQPFPPGEYWECDDIAHEFGASADGMAELIITDSEDNEVYRLSLDLDHLKSQGVSLTEETSISTSELDEDTYGICAQDVQKGTLFSGEIVTDSFDPTKLGFTHITVNGWTLITSISYDGEDLDNEGGDSEQKSFEIDFFVGG